MNIIFEGISGSGKTTIFNGVCEYLKYNNIPFESIGDLTYDTPIKNILLKMVSENPLMNNNEKFNTSIYESLLLAANHHYVQEKLRNSDKICIYDRDFLSLLAYQHVLLNDEYVNGEEIYDIYKKIVLINLKKIDYIFYIDTPLELCINRTEKRDNRLFLNEDRILLEKIKKQFLIEMNDYLDRVIILNGESNVKDNTEKVLKYVMEGI